MKPIYMSAGVLAVVWLLIFSQFASGWSSKPGDAGSAPQIQKAGAADDE